MTMAVLAPALREHCKVLVRISQAFWQVQIKRTGENYKEGFLPKDKFETTITTTITGATLECFPRLLTGRISNH